jgi:hypothetical protein
VKGKFAEAEFGLPFSGFPIPFPAFTGIHAAIQRIRDITAGASP